MKGLSNRIAGTVIERGQPSYEQVRREMTLNALKPDRYPDVIVRVDSERDVIEAVKFAGERGLKIAVRGGGHSWCASPLRDGGMLLDISRLNKVLAIDPDGRTATIQPVVQNRELARTLAERGLAFPVGHCSTVPVSGFLLNGGFGWNSGAWGVACHNLLSMEIVTADGELVTANERENTELFWAARGAGPGFFGVAVKYRLKVYPLPKAVTTSTLIYPLDRLSALAAWAAETVNILNRNVELALWLVGSPADLARETRQVCMVAAVAFAESGEEAWKALSPLSACPVNGCLAQQLNMPSSFEALYELTDRVYPAGRRYAGDTLWSGSRPSVVAEKVRERLALAPSTESSALMIMMPPPPPGAPAMPDCAFSMVAPVFAGIYSVWQDGMKDRENIDWLHATMDEMDSFTLGRYIGETELSYHPSRAKQSFAPCNWERIQSLRKKYDPRGVFHTYLGNAPNCAEAAESPVSPHCPQPRHGLNDGMREHGHAPLLSMKSGM